MFNGLYAIELYELKLMSNIRYIAKCKNNQYCMVSNVFSFAVSKIENKYVEIN